MGIRNEGVLKASGTSRDALIKFETGGKHKKNLPIRGAITNPDNSEKTKDDRRQSFFQVMDQVGDHPLAIN